GVGARLPPEEPARELFASANGCACALGADSARRFVAASKAPIVAKLRIVVFPSSLLEQRELDRGAHCLVARVAGMQVIARIDGRRELARRRRIARDAVEVDHAVVLAARSDPIVQRLALGLALRRVIRGALERRERRAIDLEATSMRSLDQLPMARDQVGCARARV